jgi:hypothetical protein
LFYSNLGAKKKQFSLRGKKQGRGHLILILGDFLRLQLYLLHLIKYTATDAMLIFRTFFYYRTVFASNGTLPGRAAKTAISLPH